MIPFIVVAVIGLGVSFLSPKKDDDGKNHGIFRPQFEQWDVIVNRNDKEPETRTFEAVVADDQLSVWK